jgi:hypothetical protein
MGEAIETKIILPPNKFAGEQRRRLIAIDPGQTTGLAEVLLAHDNSNLWNAMISTFTLRWPQQAAAIANNLDAYDVIVVEDWRLRQADAAAMVGQNLWGPKVLGWIEGNLEATGSLHKLVYQRPSTLAMFPLQTIKKWMNGFTPDTAHERDALRHLIYYLAQGA